MRGNDPEIAALRERLATMAATGAAALSLPERRRTFDETQASIPAAPDCLIQEIAGGAVCGERITPAHASAAKALLYHHGGGYTFGSPRALRHLVSRFASAAGIVAFNMQYRLAPEHQFPAALEDAVRNYRYVLEQGFAPDDIVLGGESAGGNLSVALILRIRTAGLPMPAGIYLLSPWLDMAATGESHRLGRDLIMSPQLVSAAAAAFLGGTSPADPLVSPIHADLEGFPPVMIQVGTDDAFLSDALEFTRRAALARVSVDLAVRSDMVHIWPLFHPQLPTSGPQAIREAGAWMARRLRVR